MRRLRKLGADYTKNPEDEALRQNLLTEIEQLVEQAEVTRLSQVEKQNKLLAEKSQDAAAAEGRQQVQSDL